MTARGNTQIDASTFYWVDTLCVSCTDRGMGFWITDPAATVDFRSSAVGGNAVVAFAPGSGPLLIGHNGVSGLSNRFSSDALTWVQTTENMNVVVLPSVLPNVMFDEPGLQPFTNSLMGYPRLVTPLLNTGSTPGLLVDAVANVQCGGANQLLSPNDSSCITTDVFGDPRVDAGNNSRNIGAVQTTQSPFLAVTSITTNIGLGWNRPLTRSRASSPATGSPTNQLPAERRRWWT